MHMVTPCFVKLLYTIFKNVLYAKISKLTPAVKTGMGLSIAACGPLLTIKESFSEYMYYVSGLRKIDNSMVLWAFLESLSVAVFPLGK